MARARFPFFARAPFPIVAESYAKDEDFLADAKVVLALEDSVCAALSDALTTETSFLDRETLRGVVKRVLGPEVLDAEAVADFIWLLHRALRHESDETVDRSVALLREAIAEHSNKLTKQQKKQLADRIEKLVAAPSGLARQHKAEQLAEATGTELEDLQVICDVRPVFNEARSEIEGAIPISTLKLDVTNPDGSPSRIEVRLTESQVTDLCAKAQYAESKLLVIKRLLAEKSIALPTTSATVHEGNIT